MAYSDMASKLMIPSESKGSWTKNNSEASPAMKTKSSRVAVRFFSCATADDCDSSSSGNYTST